MPITGTTTSYTGRTVDILIFGGVDGSLPGTQIDSLTFGSPSQYVAGIQKLIQRYAICMMTILGSQPTNPDFGTNMISTVTSTSKLLSQSDATHAFNFANIKTISMLREYQTTLQNAPLDEQLDTATLLSFSSSGDTIDFNISITSLAGSDVTFVIPLPKNPA